MNVKTLGAAAVLIGMGILSGCSGGGSTSTTGVAVAGRVADGYLVNAQVFLDKNGNYQLDSAEPNTTTDATGSFTLTIDPADAGKYPIVVVAVQGQTIDLDTNAAVTSTYVLSMHAVQVTQASSTSTTGTVQNFISPISTLIRETLEANPGMTVAEAMTKVRNQLDIGSGVNMMGDYVFGSYSGGHKADFQRMHDTARRMAHLMGSQAGLVMSGRVPDVARYRGMMGQMGQDLQGISYSAGQGAPMTGADMQGFENALHDAISTIPMNTFRNYSTLFRNMTSHRSFWNMSAGKQVPMRHHGMM